jgi:hypothetical protein
MFLAQHLSSHVCLFVCLFVVPAGRLVAAWWFLDRHSHGSVQRHCLQSNGMDYLRSIVAALVPELLPELPVEATADSGPLMQLLRKVAALHSSCLFWLAWLLCPGLQTAYYMFFFAATSPMKCAYATLIGEQCKGCHSHCNCCLVDYLRNHLGSDRHMVQLLW